MAGKKSKFKKKQLQNVKNKIQESISSSSEIHEKKSIQLFDKKSYLYIGVILLLTIIVYIPSINNDFVVNWDDGGYITEYEPIHDLTADNFKIIWSTFYKGNYHPVTTTLYALEYSVVGADPVLFHIINLLFHLLNTLLVFWFVSLISRRKEIAAICALFFAIHPMHVESVAWISELKDVLYSFFFLSAMISYYFFINKKNNKLKYYIYSLILFAFSLFSKSAAVTLPVVLLLIDYFAKRKLKFNLIIEKIPFFLFALGFGILAILSQGERGAIQDLAPMFSIPERLMIASYAAMVYILKLFVPINLAAMYPYPHRIDDMLPPEYFIAPFFILIIVVLVFISRKRNNYVIFGSLFFLVTISIVLQFLPVGGAIMAERYTYIPYIGLFLILGYGYVYIIDAKAGLRKKIKPIVNVVLLLFVLFLSYLSWERIKVWQDGEVLFTDQLKKFPDLPFALNNRGYLYYKYHLDYDNALKDYSRCIEVDSTFHRALSNRGVLYFNTQKYEEAVHDFNKCLILRPDNTDALIGRANTLSSLGRFSESISDYDKYIMLEAEDEKAYMWRGIAKFRIGEFDDALINFDISIKMLPTHYEAYYWKGLTYLEKKDYQSALTNLNFAASNDPSSSEIYYWRGFTNQNLNNTDAAIADYTTSILNNVNTGFCLVNRSEMYMAKGDYEKAFNDLLQAQSINHPLDRDNFFKVKNRAGK